MRIDYNNIRSTYASFKGDMSMQNGTMIMVNGQRLVDAEALAKHCGNREVLDYLARMALQQGESRPTTNRGRLWRAPTSSPTRTIATRSSSSTPTSSGSTSVRVELRNRIANQTSTSRTTSNGCSTRSSQSR